MVISLLLIAAAPHLAQAQGLPPQIPVPGAPTSKCEFSRIDASTPLRITAGEGPIPYQFACGHNRPEGVCAIYRLQPGLIVSVGQEEQGWICVTGGDSTSGWIPADRLAPVPDSPHIPISTWVGWWRHRENAPGVKNDRLLITREPGGNHLHLSGRAYWYGLNDSVHFGEVQAEAVPIGIYLHAVEPSSYGAGCVVDLKYDPKADTLNSYDNMMCGGANVRFGGTWYRFQPKR